MCGVLGIGPTLAVHSKRLRTGRQAMFSRTDRDPVRTVPVLDTVRLRPFDMGRDYLLDSPLK